MHLSSVVPPPTSPSTMTSDDAAPRHPSHPVPPGTPSLSLSVSFLSSVRVTEKHDATPCLASPSVLLHSGLAACCPASHVLASRAGGRCCRLFGPPRQPCGGSITTVSSPQLLVQWRIHRRAPRRRHRSLPPSFLSFPPLRVLSRPPPLGHRPRVLPFPHRTRTLKGDSHTGGWTAVV